MRFWYLKTNAPVDELWFVVGGFFDAYIRLEAQPGGALQVRESCACGFWRWVDDSDQDKAEDSPALDAPPLKSGPETVPEFDRVILK